MAAKEKRNKMTEMASDNTKVTVNLFNEFFQIKALKEHYSNYLDTAKELKSQLDNQEFRITVVGEFSSGKSTFINALIGQDILLHGLSETTATVTYIHCVKKDNHKINQIEVHFSQPNKQPIILDLEQDKESLKQYTTTFSNTVDVVSEIDAVHFYLNIEGIEDNVVFIDTPGLNGVAAGHREVTINEIQKAHASICLFQLRGLTDSELEFLQLVFKYQNSTMFVMNHIDGLNEREDRSYQEQLEFFHNQLQESLGVPLGIEINKQAVFGLSSLKALVANDHSIKRIYETDQADITPEERKEMWENSYFSPFQSYLWDDVIRQQKDGLLKRSIGERFDIVLSALQQEIDAKIAILNADVDDSDILKIDEHLEKIEQNKDKNSQKIQNFIDNRQRELVKDFKTEIAANFEEVVSELSCKINSEDDFEHFYKQLNDNAYGNALTHQLTKLKTDYKNSLANALQATYQEATERTESFTPNISVSKKRKIKIEHNIDANFSPTNLASSQNKLIDEISKTKLSKERLANRKSSTELNALNAKINSEKSSARTIESNRTTAIKRLGSQPAIQTKEVPYTTTVSRGGTGFLDWMIGEKEVTRYRDVKDSSRRDAWLKKKNALNEQFSQQRIDAENRLRQLQNRHSDEQQKQIVNDKKMESLSRKISQLQDDLKFKEKEFNEIYSKNKRETLKKEKVNLINKIAKQMSVPDSDIFQNHINELQNNLINNCQLIKEETSQYFERLHLQFRSNLEMLRAKQEQKLGLAASEEEVKKLALLAQEIQKIQARNIH